MRPMQSVRESAHSFSVMCCKKTFVRMGRHRFVYTALPHKSALTAFFEGDMIFLIQTEIL